MFTRIRLATIDKSITKALKSSSFYGNCKILDHKEIVIDKIDRDENWVLLANKYLDLVWSKKEYKSLFWNYEIDRNDLENIFFHMTIATMPQPILKTGPNRLSHMLVATVMYQEIEKQLLTFLKTVTTYRNQNDDNPIRRASFRFAVDLKNAHDFANGEISLEDTR